MYMKLIVNIEVSINFWYQFEFKYIKTNGRYDNSHTNHHRRYCAFNCLLGFIAFCRHLIRSFFWTEFNQNSRHCCFEHITNDIRIFMVIIGTMYLIVSYWLLKGKGWAWTVTIIVIIIGIGLRLFLPPVQDYLHHLLLPGLRLI